MITKEVKLDSGAVLKIQPGTFAESRALFQALMKEFKGVQFGAKVELGAMLKDVLCSGVSSEEIERALWVCFKGCIYNNGKGDLKIDGDTFEPVAARADYFSVCIEVAKENVLPFGKSLYAEYQRVLAMIVKDQK